MDISGFIPSPASPAGKSAGRQAGGAEQGAPKDFGTLLAKQQTTGEGRAGAASPQGPSTQGLSREGSSREGTSTEGASKEGSPLARLKEALSALSPQQQKDLGHRLEQAPDALETLTPSQQEALGSFLEGESLGQEAARILDAALSALAASPLNAEGSQAMTGDADGTGISNLDTADVAPSASPDVAQIPEVNEGPLSLSAIAARMNLIDQAGGAAVAAGRVDTSTPAMTNEGRRDPSSLAAPWQNRHATAQAMTDSAALGRQSGPGIAPADGAAATLLTEAGEARHAAFPASSTTAAGGDALPFAAGERLSGLAGTSGMTTGPSSVATPAQASGGALTAPIATQQWQQQLGQQLLGMTQRGDQQMELKLHPAELGPLSVSLKVADHGGAQAQFLSAHSQVRSALEQAIPQLREALAQQGITLGDTSVGHQASGQSQEQALAGRQSPAGERIGDMSESGPQAPSMLPPNGPLDTSLLDGRVDLYA